MKQKPIHPALQHFLDGEMILMDKPLRWTSFDAVKKVRILTGVSKVGHAGTLDPLATGLLIICTGKFTKRINEYMKMDKEYTGSITLGATTPTFDLESAPENFLSYDRITTQQIEAATLRFTGDILQVPPQHSAIKKDGKPLYLAARKGDHTAVEPRPVRIEAFEITDVQLPRIWFRVVCSTGTYIRSLASDFGNLLGTGGYLSSLRRTKIGAFDVKDAWGIPDFEQHILSKKQ